MLLALGPIGPWPPDFTSGPPSVAFYWPGLAIKLKGSNLVQKKKNEFQNINQGVIYIFYFGPLEFDPGHLKLSDTGPVGAATFKT